MHVHWQGQPLKCAEGPGRGGTCAERRYAATVPSGPARAARPRRARRPRPVSHGGPPPPPVARPSSAAGRPGMAPREAQGSEMAAANRACAVYAWAWCSGDRSSAGAIRTCTVTCKHYLQPCTYFARTAGQVRDCAVYIRPGDVYMDTLVLSFARVVYTYVRSCIICNTTAYVEGWWYQLRVRRRNVFHP